MKISKSFKIYIHIIVLSLLSHELNGAEDFSKNVIIHAKMLVKQKIISSKDGSKIINGLKKIKSLIDKGKFKFQEKFEDIHLNIEKNYLS